MKCLPLLLFAVVLTIAQIPETEKHHNKRMEQDFSEDTVKEDEELDVPKLDKPDCGFCKGIWRSCRKKNIHSPKCLRRVIKCLKKLSESTKCKKSSLHGQVPDKLKSVIEDITSRLRILENKFDAKKSTCNPKCKQGACINGICKCLYGFEGLSCEREACMDYWGKEKCKWGQTFGLCDDSNFIHCEQTCGRCDTKKCNASTTTVCGKKGGVCQKTCNKWEMQCLATTCSNNCKCCVPLDKVVTVSKKSWSSKQCPELKGTSSYGGTLPECIAGCMKNKACSVFRYRDGKVRTSHCVLSSCDPIPEPQGSYTGYKGYIINTDIRKYFTQGQ